MGANWSDFRKVRKPKSIEDCLTSVSEAVQSHDYMGALFLTQAFASPLVPTATLQMLFKVNLTDTDHQQQKQQPQQTRELLDETKLMVCFALDKTIKSPRFLIQDVLCLCTLASVLQIGEDEKQQQQQQPQGESNIWDLSLKTFHTYLNTLVTLCVQRSLLNDGGSETIGGITSSIFGLIDLIESVLLSLEQITPPGSALSLKSECILNSLLDNELQELKRLLEKFIDRSHLKEFVDPTLTKTSKLSIPEGQLLDQTCSLVQRCRIHLEICDEKMKAFKNSNEQSQNAWNSFVAITKQSQQRKEQGEDQKSEPKTVDISQFLGQKEEISTEQKQSTSTSSLEQQQQQKVKKEEEEVKEVKSHELEPASLFPSSFLSLVTNEPQISEQQKPENKQKQQKEKEKEGNEEQRKLPSDIDSILREITAFYLSAEDKFTTSLIQQAIEENSSVPAGNNPSQQQQQLTPSTTEIEIAKGTLTEFVFFALTTSIARASSMMDINTFAAVAGNSNERISVDLTNALEHWLKEWSSGATGRRLGSFIAIVNEIDCAAGNTQLLKEHAAAEITRNLSHCPQPQRAVACLDDFSHTSKALRNFARQYVSRLSKTVLSNTHNFFETFLVTDYRLSSEKFNAMEVNDPYMLEMIHAIETSLNPLLKALSQRNGDILVEIIAQDMAKQLEDVCRQKKFTQFGGLQFSRELQAFSEFCSGKSKTPLHGKFTRIKQIAHLLCLDHAFEAAEYATDASWKLEPDDTKFFLSLRADFSVSEIKDLKLAQIPTPSSSVSSSISPPGTTPR